MNCEQFTGLKKKLCEGWKVAEDGSGYRRLTDNEHKRFLAFLAGEKVPPLDKTGLNAPSINRTQRTQNAGVGTELEKLFDNFSFGTCGACAKLKNDMNRWGPNKCEEYRENILKRLEDNARKRPELKLLFNKRGAGIFVDQAIHNSRLLNQGLKAPTGIVGNLLSVAGRLISPKKIQKDTSTLTWAYGITTVPQRADQLFPRTVQSLKDAGFDTPHLFIDNCADPSIYDKYDLNYTCHSTKVGLFGNWATAIWELYTSNPHADRYAIFQDDFVTYQNLRAYLEKQEYPKDGYCNLYTFPQNHSNIASKGVGWHVSNQRGLGALALIFSNEAVSKLLTANHFVSRTMGKRGYRFIDGGVVDSFKEFGGKEYVHNPSLVQHTGSISSYGNDGQKLSPSFRGETFDALELLNE